MPNLVLPDGYCCSLLSTTRWEAHHEVMETYRKDALSQHCWLRARGNRQISDCQEKLWNSDDFALSNLPDKDPKDPLSEVLAVSRSVKTIRVQVNCLLSCVPGHFWWDSHNVQYKTEGYQQQHSLQCFIRGAWHGHVKCRLFIGDVFRLREESQESCWNERIHNRAINILYIYMKDTSTEETKRYHIIHRTKNSLCIHVLPRKKNSQIGSSTRRSLELWFRRTIFPRFCERALSATQLDKAFILLVTAWHNTRNRCFGHHWRLWFHAPSEAAINRCF